MAGKKSIVAEKYDHILQEIEDVEEQIAAMTSKILDQAALAYSAALTGSLAYTQVRVRKDSGHKLPSVVFPTKLHRVQWNGVDYFFSYGFSTGNFRQVGLHLLNRKLSPRRVERISVYPPEWLRYICHIDVSEFLVDRQEAINRLERSKRRLKDMEALLRRLGYED